MTKSSSSKFACKQKAPPSEELCASTLNSGGANGPQAFTEERSSKIRQPRPLWQEQYRPLRGSLRPGLRHVAAVAAMGRPRLQVHRPGRAAGVVLRRLARDQHLRRLPAAE